MFDEVPLFVEHWHYFTLIDLDFDCCRQCCQLMIVG